MLYKPMVTLTSLCLLALTQGHHFVKEIQKKIAGLDLKNLVDIVLVVATCSVIAGRVDDVIAGRVDDVIAGRVGDDVVCSL